MKRKMTDFASFLVGLGHGVVGCVGLPEVATEAGGEPPCHGGRGADGMIVEVSFWRRVDVRLPPIRWTGMMGAGTTSLHCEQSLRALWKNCELTRSVPTPLGTANRIRTDGYD